MTNNINWYPGHMAKAKKELEDSIKLIDIIIEIRDARMPISSCNHHFKDLYNNKKVLTIFNKSDLIDDDSICILKEKYSVNTLFINSKSKKTKSIVVDKIKELGMNKIEKNKKRGIKNTEIRVMIIGIPNVGKSTLINNISNKNSVKVENKPGITKNLQWISVDHNIKLLDTPGILPPKFNDEKTSLLLSLLGSINDNIIDKEACAEYAIEYLNNINADILKRRYGELSNYSIKNIAELKNIYKNNNELDILKTSNMIINDVRNNAFGKIVWESINA